MHPHETEQNLAKADCVVGFSFGTSVDTGSVNAQLGRVMLRYANERPLIADRTLVSAMPHAEDQIAHVIEGEPTHGFLQGLTTWDTWIEAQKYMDSHQLSRPLVVAQSYHRPRVVKQGEKLGIASMYPDGLPTDFDTHSRQLWTKSIFLWLPANALASLILRARQQL